MMIVADRFISARDTLLDTLLGIQQDAVLNSGPVDGSGAEAGPGLAQRIKRAANACKAEAILPDGSGVDYARLRESESYAVLRHQLTPQLHSFDPATLTTREAKLAFWINLYNVLVLDAVIAFDVQRSVTEGPLGILRFFRRAAYDVGGQRVTAEDIEHGILRANRGHPYLPGPHFAARDPRHAWALAVVDPRIHFALNCASRSCPPIGVYDADRLDAQLDLATRSYLAAEVQIDQAGRALYLPRLLDWYAGDFGGRQGMLDVVRRYLPDDAARTWLDETGQSMVITFRAYDWSLNVAGIPL